MNRADRPGPRARQLIRNVVSSGGGQAGILLITFLVTPVLVSKLGFNRYGLWALAGVLVNYIGLLDLGFGTSFVRFLAREHGRGDTQRFNAIVRLGLTFYTLFAIPIFILVFVTAEPLVRFFSVAEELREEAVFLLVGVTGIFLIRSIFVVYRAATAAIERIDVNNRLALLIAIPSGIGAVLVVSSGFGLRGLTLNGLVTALLTIVLQTVFAYRLIPTLRLRPFHLDRTLLPELIGYGVRLQATRLAEMLNGQVDKLVLGFIIGAASVGLYDLGLKLALLAGVLPTLLLPVILPTGALLVASGDRERLETLYRRGTKYVGWVMAPSVVFVIITAPAILKIWIGDGELGEAATAARLLVLGAAPLLALGVSRLVARGIGHPQMEMWASIVMAGANLLLSIGLVRWLGTIGAPLASCCAGFLGGAIFLTAFRRRMAGEYAFEPLRPLIAPVLVACAAGVVSLISMQLAASLVPDTGRIGALWQLVSAGVPFALVYLACLFGGSFLDDYDLHVARETWIAAREVVSRPGVTR